jgi:hypothetical protein
VKQSPDRQPSLSGLLREFELPLWPRQRAKGRRHIGRRNARVPEIPARLTLVARRSSQGPRDDRAAPAPGDGAHRARRQPADRDSMMGEPPIAVSIAPADLAQAAAVSNLARALDAPEIVEYWNSAPQLLNFMRHYSLKRLLEAQMDDPPPLSAMRCWPPGPQCSIARRSTPMPRSNRPWATASL